MDPTPTVLLLGAHRWGRERVVETAFAGGARPALLVFEGEPLPLTIRARVPARAVITVRRAATLESSRGDVCGRLGDNWWALGLDDYVCELAAALPPQDEHRCYRVEGAVDTLQKHRLRRRWNEYCARDSRLQRVEYRFLQFTSFA